MENFSQYDQYGRYDRTELQKQIRKVESLLEKIEAVGRNSSVFWNSEGGDLFRSFLFENTQTCRDLIEKWKDNSGEESGRGTDGELPDALIY